MSRTLTIVKIGGNVIDNDEALAQFVADFAALESPKILIHGGGKAATRLSSALGIETRMVKGRRVTDAETLQVVTAVYGGMINKHVVSLLQACGCNAIGLCGADGHSVMSTRRPPVEIDGQCVDFGFVGDIDPQGVNVALIDSLLQSGLTPVFCAITDDGHGHLLNSNADSVASAIACAMASTARVDLRMCFEMDGVMADIDNPDSLVPTLDMPTFIAMRDSGVVSRGMLPKIANAFAALESGVATVRIMNAAHLLKPSPGTLII